MPRGDIVLVPFPSTDLSTTQVRPAPVVSADEYSAGAGELILAMVTSQAHSLPTDYTLQDWAAAGLLYPSWVRAKIVSLEQSLVRRVIGRLSDRDLVEVDARLRLAMGL